MPLLKKKFQEDREEKQRIDAKISGEAIHATESEAECVRKISETIAAEFRDEIVKQGFSEEVKGRIRDSIARETNQLDLDYEAQKRIETLTASNITGLGPLESYMLDDTVTEIVVQRYDNICVERDGKIFPVDAAFISEGHLRTVINRIVQPIGRQINLYTPMVDARLPDGSRINATIPPVTPDGATLTIRKFSKDVMTGEDYLRFQSLSPAMLKFLEQCVESKVNIIISGGTTTGKTTLLNMLSAFIPKDELIITIEDSCELRLNQPNVRRMEARATNTEGMMPVTIQSLLRNSLRMRPDRLIIGEVRDGTVVDLMSAMSTGHDGTISTVHANSPGNLVKARLPILYSMASTPFSAEAQALQISEALQLIVQIERRFGKRRVRSITHVAGLDKQGKIVLEEIFKYNHLMSRFEATGYIPEAIVEQMRIAGVTPDLSVFNQERSHEAHA